MKISDVFEKMAEGVEGGYFFIVVDHRETFLKCIPEQWELKTSTLLATDEKGNKWKYVGNDKNMRSNLFGAQLSGVLFLEVRPALDTIGVALSRMRNTSGVSKYQVGMVESICGESSVYFKEKV